MPPFDHFDVEEFFHDRSRKEGRKERKALKARDRSKYKKSDQDQIEKRFTASTSTLPEGVVQMLTPKGIIVLYEGKIYCCSLSGRARKETTQLKSHIVVGDRVRFQIAQDDTGSIEELVPRKGTLFRAENLSHKKRQIIAANIDYLVVIASIVRPRLIPSLIDRFLITALQGGLQSILVINKIDLLKEIEDGDEIIQEICSVFEKIGVRVFPVSLETSEGLDALKEFLKRKTFVIAGQSGVGKTTLLNQLAGVDLRTKEIVERTGKGSHTTTSAVLIALGEESFCIDTPGIRSLGLRGLEMDDLRHYYPEIQKAAEGCRFLDCTHRDEPDCAVKAAVEAGDISPLRFASYLDLMLELKAKHYRR